MRHWVIPQAVACSQGSHIYVSVTESNMDSDHEMFLREFETFSPVLTNGQCRRFSVGQSLSVANEII